jgi:hypothetical protein
MSQKMQLNNEQLCLKKKKHNKLLETQTHKKLANKNYCETIKFKIIKKQYG